MINFLNRNIYNGVKKYWIIINNEIQRQFAYRIGIAAYSFGNIAEVIVMVVLWSIVYRNIETIHGYTAKEMVSYLVFAWFFSFLTTTYAFEANIAKDIQTGALNNMLVKPISYLRYMATVATGRILIALLIVLIQDILIILLLRGRLIFSADVSKIVLLLAMLSVTYLFNVLFSIGIGFLAFWTTEISGIYYALKVLRNFLSGYYFPIVLLPVALVKINLFFPFVYTAYIPVQLYLGKISFAEGLRGLAIEILWLVALYVIIKIVWRFGLKKYESVGI